jgi:hypothetical protein
MRKTQPTSLPSLPLHHPSSTGNDPLRSSAPTHEHFPACPFPSAPKPLQHRFPYFFSLDGRSPVSHPTCEVPFPPRRSGEYRKGMMPARPLYQGGCGSVWDPEPSKERVGDWGGPATVWSLLCVAETRATRPNGEWGYNTCRQCWGTSAQRRCHPEEALYLPTFSHLFDCQ